MEKVFEVRHYLVFWGISGSSWGEKRIHTTLSNLTINIGYGPLLREYVYFLLAKLAFHRQHPEFNGKSSPGDQSTLILI